MKKISMLICATMFAAFSALVVADNKVKITNQVFTVAATNDEWTDTKMKVSPGDYLITSEPGNKIVVGSYLGSADADGLNDGTGALFLKIGVGASRRIGKRSLIEVTESGAVKLRIYDTRYSDNSGSFNVSIIHIPASLIPPAQVVEQ